jgi:serine/threonine protein kinase
MVSPVQYVKTHTGFDLERDPMLQDANAVGRALRNQKPVGSADPAPRVNEAVYDAMVGFDAQQGCAFDRVANRPARLSYAQLQNLARAAGHLYRRDSWSAGHADDLASVALAAEMYGDMMRGERKAISKRHASHGIRHSLVTSDTNRADNVDGGSIYEIMNTMNARERERFQRKSAIPVHAVESTVGPSANPGQHLAKVSLGAGAFGVVRIARNIKTDEFLAVKKAHPRLELVGTRKAILPVAFPPTNYAEMSLQSRARLRELEDFIVVPENELPTASSKSVRTDRLARQLNSRSNVAVRDLVRQPQLAELLEEYGYGAMESHIRQLQKQRTAPEIPDALTTYSFSELGMMSVDQAVAALGELEAHFANHRSGADLSPSALQLMQRYAEKYAPETVHGYGAARAASAAASGRKIFNRADFHLKDADYNRRFRNCIGRNLLRSIAALHRAGFAHQDIKPKNAILAHDRRGNTTVKLVDIDHVKHAAELTGGPEVFTPIFAPPESTTPSRQPYDAEKGDAFAAGISLLKLSGVGNEVVKDLCQQVMLTLLVENHQDFGLEGEAVRILSEQKSRLAATPVFGRIYLRDARQVINPQSLEDIAQLLIQPNPAVRRTPSQVVDLPFFTDAGGLLDDAAFARHAESIVRFSSFIDYQT